MAYKPSNQLPVTGPTDPNSPYPSQLQQPIQMRRSIDASKNWFDNTQNFDAVGDAIVDYYSATIGNFVNAQRKDYAAGIVQQHSKFLNMPGLTIQYENRQGQERLSMTAYPESFVGNREIEINLDGYISFTCTGWNPGTPPPSAQPCTFNFLLNGTSIGTGFFTSDVQASVVLKFGKTALKCQSLCDQDQGGPGNPNRPTGVNPVLPPRPKSEAYQISIANQEQFVPLPPKGITVPPHPDLPGYFVYDWNDPLNTGMGSNAPYLQTPGGGNEPYNPPGQRGPIQSITYIEVPDGVLNDYGKNNFQAELTSSFAPDGQAFFVVQAEFYSRNDFRSVGQSWSKVAGTNGSITVNDRPLYWAVWTGLNDTPTINTLLPLTIDLTPQKILLPWKGAPVTPELAFDPGALHNANGSPPYNDGYWRLGDGWSSNLPPGTP